MGYLRMMGIVTGMAKSIHSFLSGSLNEILLVILLSLFVLQPDQNVMFYLCRHLEAPLKEDNTDERNIDFFINGSMVEFPPRPSSYSRVRMNGKKVFRFAVESASQSIESSLEKAALSISEIDWLLLHQVYI